MATISRSRYPPHGLNIFDQLSNGALLRVLFLFLKLKLLFLKLKYECIVGETTSLFHDSRNMNYLTTAKNRRLNG